MSPLKPMYLLPFPTNLDGVPAVELMQNIMTLLYASLQADDVNSTATLEPAQAGSWQRPKDRGPSNEVPFEGTYSVLGKP